MSRAEFSKCCELAVVLAVLIAAAANASAQIATNVPLQPAQAQRTIVVPIAVEAQVFAPRVSPRALSGMLKKFAAGELQERKPTFRERRQVRKFIRSEGNLDLLAWMIEDEIEIQFEPCPDTGRPAQDFFCTFVSNIDEIVAAIQKLLELFEGISAPTPADPLGCTETNATFTKLAARSARATCCSFVVAA